jgi:hypothetical protein
MIASLVEFIGARKWLIELILLLIVAGLIWWFCEHLIAVGVQRQKDADDKAYAHLVIQNAKEEGRLKALADTANENYQQEHQALDTYRAAQPLHGGLCLDKGRRTVSSASGAHTGNEATVTGTAAVQSVLAGDPASVGRSDPDIRHLLDLLAGRGDEVSSTLREFQAREVTVLQTGSTAHRK